MTEQVKLKTVVDERFPNLAITGNHDCDSTIQMELTAANIPFIELLGENTALHTVPYKTIGLLGNDDIIDQVKKRPDLAYIFQSFSFDDEGGFVFKRGWQYWMVHGYVPLYVAEIIYNSDANAHGVIRAGGNGNNLSPTITPQSVVKSGLICGYKVVDCYHIDTQAGLNYFVQVLKEHKLI